MNVCQKKKKNDARKIMKSQWIEGWKAQLRCGTDVSMKSTSVRLYESVSRAPSRRGIEDGDRSKTNSTARGRRNVSTGWIEDVEGGGG